MLAGVRVAARLAAQRAAAAVKADETIRDERFVLHSTLTKSAVKVTGELVSREVDVGEVGRTADFPRDSSSESVET